MSMIDYSWDFSKEEFSLDLDFFNEKDQEDKLWQARTGLNYETLCGAIETIIFMSDRPVNLQKIKNHIDPDLPLRVIHESIARLQAEYESKHHGIRLMEVAQGYQFRTKATYSRLVQNMFKVQSLQLSPTAIEVLAIIAYKQPISKTGVESVRGVDSSHIIRALMDRRLVKIAGRSDEAGRPSLYATTPEFLEVFNLNDLTQLPSEIELEELANANEIGEIADIRKIVQNGDKKKFDADELLELDELSASIQEIASETSFTTSLKQLEKSRNDEAGVEKKSAFDILEEYVSKAQIIEQNKASGESEVLTSIMEPKAVTIEMLKELLNAPKMEDDDLEVEVELEMDADEALAKSEELLDMMSENAEQALEVQLENLEVESENIESNSIEDEVDAAFDLLLGENNEDEVTLEEVNIVEAQAEDTIDTSELDIASFISHKIKSAPQVEEEKSEEITSEADELSLALDAAFEKLTGDSLDQDVDELTEKIADEAKELDIDLEFLREAESFKSSETSKE